MEILEDQSKHFITAEKHYRVQDKMLEGPVKYYLRISRSAVSRIRRNTVSVGTQLA
jgi:hypothetical protein